MANTLDKAHNTRERVLQYEKDRKACMNYVCLHKLADNAPKHVQ